LTHDDAEVRFHAAQALTYQNEADGVEILKLAARDEPAFRALALSALATIDATSATDALEDLLHVQSAETRYGAFHALLAKPSQTQVVAGKWVGDSFFLHPIKSKTDAMLHFSRANRAEIVIFNDQQTVSEDFLHVSAGLTVKAVGNDKIRITHFRPDGSDSKKICSTRVADLIEQLVERGFEYSDLLKMFRKARQNGTLNSRLVVNAMPRSDREYVPGENSLELPPERSDKYMAKAAPTLFNNGEGSSTTSAAVDETEETPSAKKTSEPIRDSLVRPASHWGKLLPFKKNAAKRGKP
jgi:hypothetical protein